MAERRYVKLFRNGRNQAVRIPVAFELPGDEAVIHRDGDRLVIEPVRKRGLVALLASMAPLAEDFPAIDDPIPPPGNARAAPHHRRRRGGGHGGPRRGRVCV